MWKVWDIDSGMKPGNMISKYPVQVRLKQKLQLLLLRNFRFSAFEGHVLALSTFLDEGRSQGFTF